MGLLKFLKNAGQKVLGRGNDSREIEKLVQTEKIEHINNLKILNKEDIVKFDFSIFEKNPQLKNS